MSNISDDVLIASLTLAGTVIAFFVREWMKRRMLRQMLFAEICSFIAVIETMQLDSSFESLIKSPPQKWSYVSHEDYFTLFEANASGLGLDGETVSHVVACYEFMKGARDARRSAASWGADNLELCRSELRRSADLLAHSLDEAAQATERLIKRDFRTGPMKRAMERILHSRQISEIAERWRTVADRPIPADITRSMTS
ncbi:MULTISPECIES: hypothetical protein [unclassified Bradyrhizobium]|uniref:hypothetical protein n=1 Tax=unclassified Bradyrhizobium TaxID=2631580 RepID=UPI0028E75D56|nr:MULTISPECIES: hypothetical protein [unclassified Bradyrhizobium]